MVPTRNNVPKDVNEIWKHLCERQRDKILKKLKKHKKKDQYCCPECSQARRLNMQQARNNSNTRTSNMSEIVNARTASNRVAMNSGISLNVPKKIPSQRMMVNGGKSNVVNRFPDMMNATGNTTTSSDENDADRMFLLCLLPHMKQVPKNRRLDLKIALMKAMRSYIVAANDNN